VVEPDLEDRPDRHVGVGVGVNSTSLAPGAWVFDWASSSMPFISGMRWSATISATA
jgi:hypothetical protein